MIRRFCDLCGEEMTTANTPSQGQNGRRLAIEIHKGGTRLAAEVITGVNGSHNAGDVCTHCILDALYMLDDRPRELPDSATLTPIA